MCARLESEAKTWCDGPVEPPERRELGGAAKRCDRPTNVDHEPADGSVDSLLGVGGSCGREPRCQDKHGADER